MARWVGRGPLLLVSSCVLLFAALAAVVCIRHGAPLSGDQAAHSWALGHEPPIVVALARGITDTGTGVWPYLFAVAAGAIAGRTTRERLRAVAAAFPGHGQLVRTGLMELFARARPARTDWAAHASGFAFPSGHSTTSALVAGLLCWAATRRAGPALARTACALAVYWAAAVGLTRVYLGVHWASDVAGGWLFGAGWLGLCLCAVARWLPGEFSGRTATPTQRTERMARATHGAGTAPETMEDHEPQDPGRRGRSRPA
ncbi:phosphatase PAP2 family protein [Streptomyces sp. NPDC002896]|uniref:phosphatase PAP2 family protein n=1 Tax=Streptomyces sp. NPDC002896 TaxID=3154438 RepID=UPI0033214669